MFCYFARTGFVRFGERCGRDPAWEIFVVHTLVGLGWRCASHIEGSLWMEFRRLNFCLERQWGVIIHGVGVVKRLSYFLYTSHFFAGNTLFALEREKKAEVEEGGGGGGWRWWMRGVFVRVLLAFAAI